MTKNKTKNTCLANKIPITLTLLTSNGGGMVMRVDKTFRKLVDKSSKGYGSNKIKQFCCEAALAWAEVLASTKGELLEARAEGRNKIIITFREKE